MATSKSTANVVSKSATTNANVVSKSATATANEVGKSTDKPVKTQRVLETRDQWAVIFNHTVSLVVTLAKGKALPTDPRKGFAFGKVAEEPHSRHYAQSLIGGFVSGKAGKVFANTVGLKDQADRQKMAIAILVGTKLGGGDATKAKDILGKAEPKQAKAFAEAVLKELSKPTEVADPKGSKAPKADDSKESAPKAPKADPKGSKAPKKADSKESKSAKAPKGKSTPKSRK